MEYYTYYTGDIYNSCDPELERKVAKAISELKYYSYKWKYREPTNIDSVIGDDSHKWYNYAEDMKEVSKKFPNAIIHIHGEGEDALDVWDAYFKNGKYIIQKVEIIYPNFSPRLFDEIED